MNIVKKSELKVWKKVLFVYAAIVLYSVLFFAISGKDVFLKQMTSDSVNQIDNFGELSDGMVVHQSFSNEAAEISSLSVNIGTYERVNQGVLHVQLMDGDAVLGEIQVDINALKHGDNLLSFSEPVKVEPGMTYVINLFTAGTSPGKGITMYYGNASSDQNNYLMLNDQKLDKKQLVYQMNYKKYDPLGNILFTGSILFLILLGLYILHMKKADEAGKNTVGM